MLGHVCGGSRYNIECEGGGADSANTIRQAISSLHKYPTMHTFKILVAGGRLSAAMKL